MPYAWPVVTNGLNAWVIVVSGELSIVRVDDTDFEELLGLVLDEHAATPAQTMAAAAMVTRLLRLSRLPMLSSCCC
jgi:hypothetical protein